MAKMPPKSRSRIETMYDAKQRAAMKQAEDMEIVEKMFVTGKGERFIRWFYMLALLFAALTHIDLLFHQVITVPEGAAGGEKTVLLFHYYSLLAYAVALLLVLIKYLPASVVFHSYDIEWLKKLGGYARKYSPVPPAGRYNAGQKVNYLATIVLGTLYVLSGLVAQFPMNFSVSLVRTSYSLHTFLLVAIALVTLMHIYLQYLVTSARLGEIWRGRVPKKFVELHHSVWFQEALSAPTFREEEERRRREKILGATKERIAKVMEKRKEKLEGAVSTEEAEEEVSVTPESAQAAELPVEVSTEEPIELVPIEEEQELEVVVQEEAEQKSTEEQAKDDETSAEHKE
jgi:formate dehydrogenase gamma subunit